MRNLLACFFCLFLVFSFPGHIHPLAGSRESPLKAIAGFLEWDKKKTPPNEQLSPTANMGKLEVLTTVASASADLL